MGSGGSVNFTKMVFFGVFLVVTNLFAWQKNGLPLVSGPGLQLNPQLIVPQGKDYFYTVWGDGNKIPSRITAGKFDASTGQPLWVSPFVVADSGGGQEAWQAVSTTSGNIIIVYQTPDTLLSGRIIFATKIGSDKTWQWPSKWVKVSTVSAWETNPQLCLDGSGEGCYLTWESTTTQRYDIRTAHISQAGDVTFEEAVTNSPSSQVQNTSPKIIPTLDGDAIVTWAKRWESPPWDSGALMGQRFSQSGERKWDTSGVLINYIAAPIPGMDYFYYRGMIKNNSGGGIVFFIPPDTKGIKAQLVSSQGEIEWQKDGVKVTTTIFRDTAQIHFDTDGYSGCMISYPDSAFIYPTRLMAYRCDSAGNAVWNSDVWDFPYPADWNWSGNNAIANTAPGECIVASNLDGDSCSPGIYAVGVDLLGKVRWTDTIWYLPNWTIEGMSVIADLKGGAYIVWGDNRNGYNNVDIFAQHVDSTGAMGIDESTEKKLISNAGQLSVEPNPFSRAVGIRCEYPEASNEVKTMKIFDVAGKLVKSFNLTNYHSPIVNITWDSRSDSGAPVPAGIYFVKAGREMKKVVRIE